MEKVSTGFMKKISVTINNDSYTSSVENGFYPGFSSVPLDKPFEDERGVIQNLVLKPITSVASIFSKKGAIRANHYHKTDTHYAYVVSGSLLYFERPIGSTEIPEPIKYFAGEMFFTPSNVEHTMLFVEDTTIITMAKNVRSHENHEADLVRVQFITEEIAKNYLE